jgi:predicted secreted protein
MTTAAITGNGITLSIGGDLIAGSTSFSLSANKATVDVTSRDDSFQAAFLNGRRDWTLDVDALYVYTDVAKKILMTEVLTGSPASISAVLTMPDGATLTGTVLCTSFSLSMPAEDAVTYTASFQGTGALTVSAS